MRNIEASTATLAQYTVADVVDKIHSWPKRCDELDLTPNLLADKVCVPYWQLAEWLNKGVGIALWQFAMIETTLTMLEGFVND